VPKPTTQPGVTVDRTLPGWPAHGRLRAGDRIVAVDGHRVDAANPLDSLRNLVVGRVKADQVMLTIVRDGRELPASIPGLASPLDAPAMQPPALLDNVADLLRVFSSASYVSWQPSGERISARLELELAPGVPGAGLAKITMISPSTAPAATPPATAPASGAPGTAPADTSSRPAQ
jgi:hypothetical protein